MGTEDRKADTVSIVNTVLEKQKKNPKKNRSLFNKISSLVLKAKEKILIGDYENLGMLMDQNQMLLSELGVSTEKLDAMISASKKAGAFGAKLSGAGGGDCMIALVPPDKKTGYTSGNRICWG